MGAPWIHPAHTKSLAMNITKSLPVGLVGQTDKLAYAIGAVSGPALQFSLGAYETVAGWFGKSDEQLEPDAQFEKAVMPKAIGFAYSGSVKGISDDALLLMMKKTEPGWGDWGDYDVGIPRLRELLRAQGKRLEVDVFLAKDDFMVGDAGTIGPEWFDKCWKDTAGDGPITYTSTVVPDSDHDSTWMLAGGVPQKVMAKIGVPEESDA